MHCTYGMIIEWNFNKNHWELSEYGMKIAKHTDYFGKWLCQVFRNNTSVTRDLIWLSRSTSCPIRSCLPMATFLHRSQTQVCSQNAPSWYLTTSHQSMASFVQPKYVYVPSRLPSPRFTGQGIYLSKLRTYFGTTGQTSQRRFLLHGKGGVGKTQLALKYAEESAGRYVDSEPKSISCNHWLD